MSDIAEIFLAQIWNSQWLQQPLCTSTGESVRIIYPGVWTHGFGPDFRGAMLDIDGSLIEGDVEIDLDVRGWHDHGHGQNPAFDQVVLQVVAREDEADRVRRSDGGLVPRVVLMSYLRGQLEDFPVMGLRPLGAIGFEPCVERPAAERPDLVREIWERAGERRMQGKVAALGGEMSVSPPAQVLYARLLDALGFSRNRDPMAEVAARLPYEQLSTRLNTPRPAERFWRAASLLIGAGGFFPLAPKDSAAAELEPSRVGHMEAIWSETGRPWHGIEVPASFWSMARIRPAAHPVRRLLAGAAILAAARNGLVEELVSRLREPDAPVALTRWLVQDNPYLGRDHAHEVIVNVVIPFALAYGEESSQEEIVDAAAELWHGLPAGRGNAVTRRTRRQICGDSAVKPGTARAEQGLIHINRNGCSQMRCFECPIARLALEWESASAGPQTDS